MKKRLWTLILLVILVSFSIYVIAGKEESSGPKILSAMADPPKVYPNQTLKILVEVEDPYGIESATAEYFHEEGSDTVDMILIAADEERETYQSMWVVHDTLIDKFYNTKITLKNRKGQTTATEVEWEDPEVVTHGWGNITGAGYCIFWNSTGSCPAGFSFPYIGGNAIYGPLLVVNNATVGCGISCPGYGHRWHFHIMNGTTTGAYDNGQKDGTHSQVAAPYWHTHNVTDVTTYGPVNNLPPFKYIAICCKT